MSLGECHFVVITVFCLDFHLQLMYALVLVHIYFQSVDCLYIPRHITTLDVTILTSLEKGPPMPAASALELVMLD